MDFPEYEKFLKGLFSKNVSDTDFMDLIFRHFVEKYNIKGKKGEVFYFDKGNVSRILNGNLAISQDFLCHVDDEGLLDSLAKDWDKKVIKELSQDKQVLHKKLAVAIDKDITITQSTRRLYMWLLNEQRYNVLMANMFLDALKTLIVKETKTIGRSEAPYLHLKSIDSNGELTDLIEAVKFGDMFDIHPEKMCQSIEHHIKQIKKMKNKEDEDIDPQEELLRRCAYNAPKTEINKQWKKVILGFADENDIAIDDMFFDLWNLKQSIYNLGQKPLQIGTIAEKEKYYEIEKLASEILEYNKKARINRYYGDIFLLKLALSNDGSEPSFDIKVGLYISEEDLYTEDDLRKIELYDLEYLSNIMDFESILH